MGVASLCRKTRGERVGVFSGRGDRLSWLQELGEVSDAVWVGWGWGWDSLCPEGWFTSLLSTMLVPVASWVKVAQKPPGINKNFPDESVHSAVSGQQ